MMFEWSLHFKIFTRTITTLLSLCKHIAPTHLTISIHPFKNCPRGIRLVQIQTTVVKVNFYRLSLHIHERGSAQMY